MNQFFRLFLVANLFGCVIPTPLFAATAEIPPLWSPREAVAYAIKYNPDIAMAIERIAMARSTSQLAESTDYPQLNIQAEYSATNNPMYSFGNILNQGEFSNNIDFSFLITEISGQNPVVFPD